VATHWILMVCFTQHNFIFGFTHTIPDLCGFHPHDSLIYGSPTKPLIYVAHPRFLDYVAHHTIPDLCGSPTIPDSSCTSPNTDLWIYVAPHDS
jgi:hypothetical protein